MQRLWDQIDLHVAALLLVSAPVGLLGGWWLAVPVLLPQGVIVTRAIDRSASQRSPWPGLLANELLVCAVALVVVGAQLVFT